jgi:plasmid stabilization system protein ParE
MADTHRVLLTAGALADLQAIAGHIRRDSPQNAAAVAERIIDAIDSLASMPTRFRRVGTSRKRGTPVHSVVVRPFIVYYRVEQRTASVHVLHVIHGKRRQPKRFK